METLADRMKGYEKENRTYLERKQPVILRLDGKAFHTFTKGFVRPYDSLLIETMQETTKYLCENIQGCKMGYTQSDEITLVLSDMDREESEGWFGNQVQKMVSVSASMATMVFNRVFAEKVMELPEEEQSRYRGKLHTAMFDSRAFSLPVHEVCNCLIWRQQDAIRNSILMLGQHHFSFKQMQCKSCNEVKEMLKVKGVDWAERTEVEKKGSVLEKREVVEEIEYKGEKQTVVRKRWFVMEETPIFSEEREVVDRFFSLAEKLESK